MNKLAFNQGVLLGYRVAGGGQQKRAAGGSMMPPDVESASALPRAAEEGAYKPGKGQSIPPSELTGRGVSGGKPKPKSKAKAKAGGGAAAGKSVFTPTAEQLRAAMGKDPGLLTQVGHGAASMAPGLVGRRVLPSASGRAMKAAPNRLKILGAALMTLGAASTAGAGYAAARATE